PPVAEAGRPSGRRVAAGEQPGQSGGKKTLSPSAGIMTRPTVQAPACHRGPSAGSTLHSMAPVGISDGCAKASRGCNPDLRRLIGVRPGGAHGAFRARDGLRRVATPFAWGKNQKETPQPWLRGFGVKTLAMTYSRMLGAHYHRRVRVSLPSSGWDRVVPRSYCHQGEGGGSRGRWIGR